MTKQIRSLWRTTCLAVAGLTVMVSFAFAAKTAPTDANSSGSKPQMPKSANVVSTSKAKSYLNHDLEFIENKGQIRDAKGNASDIKFVASSKGTSVFFSPKGLAYVFQKVDASKVKEFPHNEDEFAPKVTLQRLDMELVGATTQNIVPSELLPGTMNYYTAGTGENGVHGVRTFEKLTYENVYPNIDMTLVSKGKGLKAEFIVRPGGDPSQIKMRFSNTESVGLDKDGGLLVKSSFGSISEDAPFSFVLNNDQKEEVAVTFNVNGDVVSFNVPNYDRTKTLVIDPTRDWATYHGGTGNEQPWGACVEKTVPTALATGNPRVFICGQTTATMTFLPTVNTVGTTGGVDAFVASYNQDGSRNWLTIIGGTGNDIAYAVDVDPSNANVWVVGSTTSSTDMTAGTGIYQSARSGSTDGFINRLSLTAGTRDAGTYYGDNQTDYCRAIKVESTSRIHVGGYTANTAGATYFGTAGAYQTTYQGGSFNGYISRFSAFDASAQTRSVSTYVGGTTAGRETVVSCIATSGTTIWAGGYTNHDDGIASLGSHSVSLNDGNPGSANYDGWVGHYDDNLARSAAGTGASYYGGSGVDQINCIAYDELGSRIVVVGQTDGSATLIASAASVVRTAYGGGATDGILGIFSNTTTAMTFVSGTYVGDAGNDILRAVAVDNNPSLAVGAGNVQSIIVAGEVSSAAPTSNTGATITGLTGYTGIVGGEDGYVARFTSNLNSIPNYAIMGTAGTDGVYALAFDQMRNYVSVGRTTSNTTNTTISSTAYTSAWGATNNVPVAVQPAHGGGSSDAFLFKSCDLPTPQAPTWSLNSGAFGTTAQPCVQLNASASGVATGNTPQTTHATQVGTNIYGTPVVAGWPAGANAQQYLRMQVPNPIAGVTYTLVHNNGGTLTLTSISATATQAQETAAALNIDVPSSTLNAAPFAVGANVVYWLARTQAGCADSSTNSTITLLAQPSNNAITQTAPGTATGITAVAPSGDGSNSAIANGGAFYICPGIVNEFQPLSNAAPNNNFFFWSFYRKNGSTLTPTGFVGTDVQSPGANQNTIARITPPTTITTRDTLYVIMRETNAAGCSNEYRATLYTIPLVSIENGRSHSETAGNNPGVNPTNLCVTTTGTIQSPTTPNPLFGKSPIQANPYPGNGLTFPTATYAWTAGTFVGWSAAPTINFTTASLENTNITNITGGLPTSNPATGVLTFTESYVSAGGPGPWHGINGASRAANSVTTNFYAQPTVALTITSTPVCEGNTFTYNFAVTPSTITSGTFAVTLGQANIAGATITGASSASLTTGSGTNSVTGSFSAANFSITVSTPLNSVSTAYDGQGTITIPTFSLTNGSSPTGCSTTTFSGSSSVTVTQVPENVTSMTSQNANTNTPQGITPVATTMLPNSTLQTDATAPFTMDACLYDGTANGYGQQYTYVVAAPAGGANANDYYDWTIPAGGTIQAGGDGVGGTSVTVRWTTSGSKSITVQQQNDQAPAGALPDATNSCRTTTTFTTNVRTAPALGTVAWNPSNNVVCESGTITLNITGGPANGSAQIYDMNALAITGGGTFTPPSLPIATVVLDGTGAGNIAVPSGSIAGTATPPGFADVVYRVAFMDALANGAQCAATGVLPSIRVYDQPVVPTVTGPTPVCPNMTTSSTPANNVVTPPAPPVASYTYNVSNTASHVSGTSYAWTLTNAGATVTYVNGVDYSITLGSSGGYTNNTASVTFGVNLSSSNVEWHLVATYPTSAGGCTSPTALGSNLSQTVAVSAIPVPNIAGNNANGIASLTTVPPITAGLCAGQTAIYQADVVSGGPFTTYNWSVTAGGVTGTAIVGSNTNPTVTIQYGTITTPPSIQAHITPMPLITVTVQNAALCQNTDTNSVYIKPIPNAAITFVPNATNDSACAFNSENAHIRAYAVPSPTNGTTISVAWTISGTANGSVYSYTSSTGNTNDTVRVQWANGGTGTVQATVTSTNTCTNTATFTHQVFVPPAPVITGPAAICKDNQGTYTVTPNVPGDRYNWEIIPSTGGTFVGASSGVGLISTTINWNGPANTVYTLRCTQVSAVGCTARTTYSVTVNPNPAPNVTGPSTACTSQNIVLTTQNNAPTSTYTWAFATNTTGAAIVSGGNTASVTVNSGATAGTFSMNVTEVVSATSCTTVSSNYTVTVSATPNGVITRTTAPGNSAVGTACVGQSVAYSAAPASGVTYAWSVTTGGGVVTGPTTQTPTVAWNATGAQTLRLIVTNTSSLCADTTDQAVNVLAVPAPVISGDAQACRGGVAPSIQYTYTTPFVSGNTYQWNLPANVTNVGPVTNNSVVVTFDDGAANTVNLSVIETNASNCSTTANFSVALRQRGNPSITATSPVCQNSTGNVITAGSLISLANQVPPYTLNWTVTGGTITSGQGTGTINVTWGTAGTGTVTLTESNAGLCSVTTAPTSVVVNPAPTAFNVVPSTTSTCVNTAYTISLDGSQSAPATTYQLIENGSPTGSPVAGTGGALNFAAITKSAAGTFSYTVVATATATGCTATMTGAAVVTVNALPNATITGSTPVCQGVAGTFSVPTAGSQSYVWSAPSGWTIANQGTNSITATPGAGAAAGNITVAVTNTTTGCSNTGTFAVAATPAPTAFNVTPATSQVCRPNTGTTTFNVQVSSSQTGVTYQVFNGTSALTGASATGTGAALSIPVTVGTGGNIVNTGTYTLTVQATGAAPCNTIPVTMNGAVALTVNPTPTPAVAGPASACSGATGLVYSTTDNAGSTYSWTIPAGWTITAGNNTATITVTAGTAGGNFAVTETVSATTCSATSANYAVAIVATPAPVITPTTAVCEGTSATYSITAVSGATYAWTVPSANGSITSGQGTTSIGVNWTGAGNPVVSVAVTAGGCTGTGTATIQVVARPIAYNVATTTPNVCAGGTATITLSNSQTGVSYEFRRNGTAFATVSGTGSSLTQTNTIATAGTYNYQVVATGSAPTNCVNTMTGTATVTVTTPPTPTVAGSTSVCANSSAVYSVTPVNAGSTYAWTVTPSGTPFTSNANQATVNWATTSGTVSAVETDVNGCTGTSNTVSVTVLALPVAQTVQFTPSNTAALTICAAGGTAGTNTATIGLASSENGYTYTLLNGTTTVATATGTGAALNFSPALSGLTAGTYTYTVRAVSNTAPACTTAAMANSVILTVVANPAPTVAGNINPCVNVTETYTSSPNSGNTYTWTPAGGTFTIIAQSNNQIQLQWTSAGTGRSLTVRETNTNGCAQDYTLNSITVNATPNPTITAAPTTNPVCSGTSVTYSVPNTFSSYTWSVGTGGTIQSGGNGSNSVTVLWTNTLAPDQALTSQVGVTVGSGACTGSATPLSVTVHPQANPTIASANGATSCSGEQRTYSIAAPVTGRTYAWSISGAPSGTTPTSGTGTSFTVTWGTATVPSTNAVVSVVETPAVGTCTGTNTFNVQINPNPTVSISGPTQACQNSVVTYVATTNVSAPSTFNWSVTGAASYVPSGNTVSVTMPASGNVTINLTQTVNGTGCIGTAAPVTVNNVQNPAPAIQNPPGNVSCANSTVTYSLATPFQTGHTYIWTVTGAVTPTAPVTQTTAPIQLAVQWGGPGTGTVALTQTDGVGCTGTTTRSVTIEPLPTANIAGPATVCPGVDATYSVPFQANHSYQWNFNTLPVQIVGGSNTGNTVTVKWNNVASITTSNVTLTITSGAGCTNNPNPAVYPVIVNPAPVPSFTTPAPAANENLTNVCGFMSQYDGVAYNNTQTYRVMNPVDAVNSVFTWTLPNNGGTFVGAASGAGVTNVTIQWTEPTAAATAVYVLRVEETTPASMNSCSGTTDLNVQVNWNPKPVVSGPRAWCDNTPYSANSTVAVAQSGNATYTAAVPVVPSLPTGATRTYVWTVTNGSIVSGQGTTNIAVSWANTGTSPITGVVTLNETISYPAGSTINPVRPSGNAGCTIVDTFRVTVNPKPTPVITTTTPDGITGPNSQGPCGEKTYTYQTAMNATSTYMWTVSGGSIVGSATGSSINVTMDDVASVTAGWVQVAETFTATGCSTTVRQNYNINPTPDPVITGPTVVCQGNTTNGTNIGTYTASSTVPAGTTREYMWTVVGPTGTTVTPATAVGNWTSDATITIAWGGATTTALSGTVTLMERVVSPVASLCEDQTTMNVTINPNPTPIITSSTNGLNVNGVCANSTHTYSTTNNAGNSYTWVINGGAIVSGQNTNTVTVTWGAANTGASVEVTERVGPTPGTGCYTTVRANITVQPLPTPSLAANSNQACAYATNTYSTANVSGNSYAWTVAGGSIVGSSTTSTINVAWGAAGTGTVSVTETTPVTAGSCSQIANLTVTINPRPTPSITGPGSVCLNSAYQYADNTTATTGFSYVWNVTGGTVQSGAGTNQVTVLWTAAGSRSISLTKTILATGCDTTVSRTIQVNALPVVTITPSGPTQICTGGTVTLAATPGFATYAWSTGETTPNITVGQAGTYTVSVVDINGCTGAPASITITQRTVTKPVVTANPGTTFCQGGSTTLDAGVVANAYLWSNGATTRTINVTRSGFYSVTVTYVSGSSTCTASSDPIEITVTPKPVATVTANGPTTFCQDGEVVLDAGASATTYTWYNGTTVVGSQRTFRATESGSYRVYVTNGVCGDTSAATVVTVNPKPVVSITASGPLTFCDGGNVVLDAGGNFANYAWNGTTANTKTITVTTSGKYSVVVTDANGCTATSHEVEVTVNPLPAKPSINKNGNILSTSTAASYQWSKIGSGNIAGATNQQYDAFPTGNGFYKVRITDANGCSNESDSIDVTVISVEEEVATNGIAVYPNPTSGNVEIRMNINESTFANVVVRNLIGVEVMAVRLSELSAGLNSKQLDLTQLANGTYFIEVVTPEGKRMSARVVKQN